LRDGRRAGEFNDGDDRMQPHRQKILPFLNYVLLAQTVTHYPPRAKFLLVRRFRMKSPLSAEEIKTAERTFKASLLPHLIISFNWKSTVCVGT
jgi:hypothetical protein